MTKKIIIGLLSVVAIAGGVAAMSAYEAHVINVTAHIENALKIIPPDKLTFGTVFPQEYQTKTLSITTSSSFCSSTQRRVLNIDYKIVQKPKPLKSEDAEWCHNWMEEHSTTDSFFDIFLEVSTDSEFQRKCYLPLCPYLSKTPKDPDGDYGVPAFHNPAATTSIATGTLNKDHDLLDEWIIDLAVPCFQGMCAQDWNEFVHRYNSQANPDDYIVPAEFESKDFGCDLWVEVTNIY